MVYSLFAMLGFATVGTLSVHFLTRGKTKLPPKNSLKFIENLWNSHRFGSFARFGSERDNKAPSPFESSPSVKRNALFKSFKSEQTMDHIKNPKPSATPPYSPTSINGVNLGLTLGSDDQVGHYHFEHEERKERKLQIFCIKATSANNVAMVP
jgi:hypothetical protein